MSKLEIYGHIKKNKYLIKEMSLKIDVIKKKKKSTWIF